MLNIETYGGGLWNTWFDRDLGLAGRVLVRRGDKVVPCLIKVDKPILRIPMLAIHLLRDIDTAGFKPNYQTNLVPLLATAARNQLEKPSPPAPSPPPSTSPAEPSSDPAAAPPAPCPAPDKANEAKHHAVLLTLLSDSLACSPADIVDFELQLCDVQPGVVGGINDEFVFSGRLDNLCMSYVSLQASTWPPPHTQPVHVIRLPAGKHMVPPPHTTCAHHTSPCRQAQAHAQIHKHSAGKGIPAPPTQPVHVVRRPAGKHMPLPTPTHSLHAGMPTIALQPVPRC